MGGSCTLHVLRFGRVAKVSWEGARPPCGTGPSVSSRRYSGRPAKTRTATHRVCVGRGSDDEGSAAERARDPCVPEISFPIAPALGCIVEVSTHKNWTFIRSLPYVDTCTCFLIVNATGSYNNNNTIRRRKLLPCSVQQFQIHQLSSRTGGHRRRIGLEFAKARAQILHIATEQDARPPTDWANGCAVGGLHSLVTSTTQSNRPALLFPRAPFFHSTVPPTGPNVHEVFFPPH